MDKQILLDELTSDPAALAAYHALNEAGGRVFIVGGALRDAILGKTPKDIDLMVTGLSKQDIQKTLKSLPGHATFAGKNFGVFHYHYADSTVEVAMPRTEVSTGAGHKDFDINADPSLSPQEDLQRRDFTANALAYDISSGDLIDPHNGLQDIQEGRLRLVSPQSFVDDPLRIIRAIVAYSKHGLEPDEYTLEQMTENAWRIKSLPDERIQKELDKIMSGDNPAGAMLIAYQTGVLRHILPEVDNAMGFDQHNPYHDLPVGEHCLAVLKKMTELSPDPDLRMAALLHDVGKPGTFWQDEQGTGHFYKHDDDEDGMDHEDLGAQMTDQAMKRLKYPNDRRSRVVHLVQNHMFPYFGGEKGARKFIDRAGSQQAADDLLNLREADASGSHSNGVPSGRDQEALENIRAVVNKVNTAQPQGTVLAINGHDLINLGIQPGPQMRTILQALKEDVLDNPDLNTKDQLIQIVRELHESI